MIWLSMRNAALARHWWFNQMFEGGCPICRQWHVAMVRAFYGF